MIGWLFDFLFSNIWILFIILWVFRSFSKGVKQGMEGERRQQPSPTTQLPLDIPWDWDVDKDREVKITPPRDMEEMVPIENHRQEPEKKKPMTMPRQAVPFSPVQNETERGQLPAPVQGMIWSQIYGPPRSKQPHRSRRR